MVLGGILIPDELGSLAIDMSTIIIVISNDFPGALQLSDVDSGRGPSEFLKVLSELVKLVSQVLGGLCFESCIELCDFLFFFLLTFTFLSFLYEVVNDLVLPLIPSILRWLDVCLSCL